MIVSIISLGDGNECFASGNHAVPQTKGKIMDTNMETGFM